LVDLAVMAAVVWILRRLARAPLDLPADPLRPAITP
jgi:hypothetical protein